MRRAQAAGCALAVILLLGAGRAAASGYHPDFDTAVEEAPWIVLHTVSSEMTPAAALADLPADGRGRAYHVKVKRCYRGPFRPGDELIVWDPWYMSTAGYYLDTTGENLTFLSPPGARRRFRVPPPRDRASRDRPSRDRASRDRASRDRPSRDRAGQPPVWRTHETYGGKARARVAGLKVGVPIRNLGGGPAKGRNDGLKAWIRLLELTRVGARALDLAQARAILRGPFDRVLHTYMLGHWPEALGRADAASVRALLRRHLGDAGVTTAALALLRRSKIALGPAELRALLERGDPHARPAILGDVVASNVGGVKDVLWSWIQKDELGALQALEILAPLTPAYLKQQLRVTRLPFWLEIPALNALRMRPEDIGRPPYPVAIKALRALQAWALHGVGRLVKGQTFDGMYPMLRRDESWAAYFPLILPHLPRMSAETREIAIAFMRTLRFEVRRLGQTAVLGPRTTVPLDLRLEWVPGLPGKVRVTERALRPLLLCATTERRVELHTSVGMVRGVDGTYGAFSSPAAPKDCFRVTTGVVRSEIIDVSQVLSGATGPGTALGPGPFHLEVALIHARSGAEHGLDAWTGLVVSSPLPLPRAR